MKKLAIFALVSLVLAMPAVAQPEAGDLGVFLDPAGTITSGPLPEFVQASLYVLGFDLGGITGWESSVTFSDPGILVFNTALNPGGALNVGQVGNFIVGLGACINAGATHTLVTYLIGDYGNNGPQPDVLVCVGGTTPSSFGGLPGYSTCDDVLTPFGLAENGGQDYPNGCAVLNPTGIGPVGTENLSLGAVKAKF